MKQIISAAAGFLAAAFIFYLDDQLIKWVLGLLPDSINDWKPFLKAVCWILALFWTTAIALMVGVLAGAWVSALFEGTKRK